MTQCIRMMATDRLMIRAVAVFVTDVSNTRQADRLIRLLRHRYPNARITIDLEDKDKVLRIEGEDVCPDEVVGLLAHQEVYCVLME